MLSIPNNLCDEASCGVNGTFNSEECGEVGMVAEACAAVALWFRDQIKSMPADAITAGEDRLLETAVVNELHRIITGRP